MAARQPSDYTIAELKNILRERNLASTGNKSDLIDRLTSFDPNIWVSQDELRVRPVRDIDCSVEGDRQLTDEALSGENDRGQRDNHTQEATMNVPLSENELVRRENELLKRERTLLQRELEVARRQGTESQGSSRTNSSAGRPVNENVRAVRDLLSEFDGSEGTFWKWEQQIRLLRITYALDESATRILISAKVKGRALEWFHSKPEHLTRSIEDLLTEMRGIFDLRQSKMELRRKFEKREWQSSESFSDYYHEKIILANRVPIEDEEVTDYIIDGITDRHLQDQARIMQFDSHVTLLEAFKKVTLYPRKPADRELKNQPVKSQDGRKEEKSLTKGTVASSKGSSASSSENSSSRRKTLKCYNCKEAGHLAPSCPQPRKVRGACYRCGSTSHIRKDCPEEEPKSAPKTEASLIEPVPISDPYYVKIKFPVLDSNGNGRERLTNAVVDPGSPVSLIKCEYVPEKLRGPVPSNGNKLHGMNKSRVHVLGTFSETIDIEGIDIKMRFLVVPSETMSCEVLLGRDFSRNPLIKVELGEVIKIIKNPVSTDEVITQAMQIEYLESPIKVSEELNINPSIDLKIAKKVKELYDEEYIAKRNSDAKEPEPEMKILLKNEQPITFRPRRLTFSDKEKLQVILKELLETGIIRPSKSPYASPVVLVRKKDGGLRLCVDFRELNKLTIKDNFPTPLIDDHIDRLKGRRYFSSIDLKNGFYHVKMSECSIKYTSFVTPLGQFEFLRMPFGLTNAPRVFQRFIKEIYEKLAQKDKVFPYIDDLLVATEEVEEHLNILKEVFEIARRHRLQFRLDKCFFVRTDITYLGYSIDEHGIRPSRQNIESVINYPIPRNTKEVHRFVCLASYFRRFIPNFSVLAKPLYDLIKRNVPFKFGPEESRVVETLKRLLSSQPVLAIYSPNLETELHCDASASGVGAILLQKQNDKIFRPVFYFSKRTTAVESKYHSFELECLAVVYAIKRFHIYLAGIPFKIITDCDSFRLTLSKQTVNPRVYRWALFLEQYTYEIIHRTGTRMGHVDALSRCHSILVLEANSFEQTLSIQQDRDATILKIRNKLDTMEDKFYELRDGLVYRKDKDKKLLFYVPSSMENNVIRNSHDNVGHVGIDKVVNNICKVYWFPRMREKVKDYIANCLRCIEFSPPSGKREGRLHSIPKANLPFQTIHVDHCGPFEKTGGGYRYILSIVDAFTKFIKLYACKSTTSEESIKHLRSYSNTYSKPQRIISDRGTAFTSDKFKTFVSNEHIQHVLVAVGTPRANGQVERFNRVITPMIAKLCEDPNKWDQVLSKVEQAINNTVCRSTGETPSRLLFGINQLNEINDSLKLILDSYSDGNRDLVSIRESASRKIKKSQEENERYYDQKHKKAKCYKEGDYVMIRNVDTSAGSNKKLIPKYKGPYVVEKVLSSDRYLVRDIEGFQVTQMPYSGVIAVDQMKPYIQK